MSSASILYCTCGEGSLTQMVKMGIREFTLCPSVFSRQLSDVRSELSIATSASLVVHLDCNDESKRGCWRWSREVLIQRVSIVTRAGALLRDAAVRFDRVLTFSSVLLTCESMFQHSHLLEAHRSNSLKCASLSNLIYNALFYTV